MRLPKLNSTIKDKKICVNFNITGRTGQKHKATWKQRHWFNRKAVKPHGIQIDLEFVKSSDTSAHFESSHNDEFKENFYDNERFGAFVAKLKN